MAPPTTTTERSSRSRRRTLTGLALATTLFAAACGSTTTDQVSAEPDPAADQDSAVVAPAQGSDDSDDETAAAVESVRVTIENIAAFPITSSGSFTVPVGADGPAPALPGESYAFSFYANPGDRLSFATMFVQTNDWFFAPDPAGIELFDADGNPISGDVTDQILVFDGGTEIDQPVGEGADQAPRQAGPNTGDADPDTSIRLVDRDAANYVGVLVEPGEGGRFDVTIENVSEMATVPSPISPGVYAAHSPDVALFTVGEADAGNGLEAIAEDGDAAPFAEFLATLTGTTTPIPPGAWAVHDPAVALYELGGIDAGLGLEAIAEDGDGGPLAEALAAVDGVAAAGAFNTPDGASEPGPALPGSTYSFEVPIDSGGRLSFATMFVQTNDWIFATPPEGLDVEGLSGDITDQLLVVDVGTEVDQQPGFGADQAPRQSGPDVGADDPDSTVRIVDGRSATRYIQVTVEPVG